MTDQNPLGELVAWVVRVPNGNVRYWTRDKDRAHIKAAEWGLKAVCEPLSPRPFVPEAVEIEDALDEIGKRIPPTILHGNSFGHEGFYPHNAIKTLVAALYAAPSPVEHVSDPYMLPERVQKSGENEHVAASPPSRALSPGERGSVARLTNLAQVLRAEAAEKEGQSRQDDLDDARAIDTLLNILQPEGEANG